VEKGNVDLDLSGIKFSPNNGKPEWNAVINSIHLQNPNSLLVGPGKNKLSIEQITAGNITLSSAHITDFSKMARANVSAWLKSATGQYIDSTTTLKWYNASYNAEKKIMNLDSFAYYPTQVRDTVIKRSKYQTDYITFRSGPVKINDFSLEKYEKDSALMAKTIEFKDPYITVFRDKLPPVLSGATKPLPVDMIRNIPFPVRVKNVKMEDGTVLYTEKHPKTRAEGTLSLTHLNLSLKNIKNQGLDDNDSLELKADTYLMDSALIHLVVNESYADSLGGFLMTLRMKPTTLSFLNPVLAPLSNIIITSGTIDSLQLRAVGKNDLAFGEMKMYYHNLHIKLIKDGDLNKTTFFTRAATTLLNALLVHKNNNGKRTGVVYFERLKDRSFFNYIVKIAFSGMATSIGVKKNSRYMKQYRKELKKNNLPPIDFD
jgi:hypothetical protein